MNSNVCIVYGLRAVDSNDYFYVGSTKFTAEQRLKQHLDYIRLGYNKNRHLVNKVAKIGAVNVAVDVLEQVNDENRFEREYVWIADLRRKGIKLTNVVLSVEAIEAKSNEEAYIEKYADPKIMRRLFCLLLSRRCTGCGPANPRNLDLSRRFEQLAMKAFKHLLDTQPDELLALLFFDVSPS